MRPFLVIGILAAVRDMLSASAHLNLASNLTRQTFAQNLLEPVGGVAVVVVLLFGLLLLRWSGPVTIPCHAPRAADTDR